MNYRYLTAVINYTRLSTTFFHISKVNFRWTSIKCFHDDTPVLRLGGQSAKTADWIEDNDVKWLCLRNYSEERQRRNSIHNGVLDFDLSSAILKMERRQYKCDSSAHV